MEGKGFKINGKTILVMLGLLAILGTMSEKKAQNDIPTVDEYAQQVEVEYEQQPEAQDSTVAMEDAQEVVEDVVVDVEQSDIDSVETVGFDLSDIPEYSGSPYVTLNNNEPYFTDEEKMNTEAFEQYAELDALGRCGAAYANVCKELQPTEERGAIGHVKPSGWQTVKYNGYVEGNYLYNRCHLIGYQLTGENANVQNLITGTRYMNVDGQLPFENYIDDYLEEMVNNHVLYRVTPIYEGDNLVATGLLTEAYSVEDNGNGVQFCVFIYNAQPGIGIDYSNGDSWMIEGYEGEYANNNVFSDTSETAEQSEGETGEQFEGTFADGANVSLEHMEAYAGTCFIAGSGKKYHSINDCGTMNPNNASNISIEDAEAQGYTACSNCW